MNLREVLAEAVDTHELWTDGDPGRVADVILARLSQPDVLYEFERRFGLATLDPATRGGLGFIMLGKRVLSDMLGGGS